MALSMNDVDNPQGEKKGKDKNKDLAVFVDERLVGINNPMATLTTRVDDMNKHLEERESMGDFDSASRRGASDGELVIADVNKELQALWASEAI